MHALNIIFILQQVELMRSNNYSKSILLDAMIKICFYFSHIIFD